MGILLLVLCLIFFYGLSLLKSVLEQNIRQYGNDSTFDFSPFITRGVEPRVILLLK